MEIFGKKFSYKFEQRLKNEFSNNQMVSKMYSLDLIDMALFVLAISDLMWAIGSFAFVFFYMLFHTQSLFFPAIAMYQILISFPLAYFFYKIIF
jgi:hypothetical protein